MFSKILIKLIDQSIVPAIFLIITRILSIVFVGKYHNISFELGTAGFEYTSHKEYVLVNSYSVLVMVILIAIGLLYILLKSFIFHESHITPHMTAKVFSLRLSAFIQSSFDLYSQGAIWLSYMYLLMFVSGIMALFGFLYTWVFGTALLLTILNTVLLILDVENELQLEKEVNDEDDSEDTVLNFGSAYEQ